ncbi:AGAP003468-PA-like protein [Anopheles sinensis]|uniref:AGAP003468-PA-like protein n=1 Tax=Anopheles sinensis TaxID=74873 RepID=A0A084WMB0_ANOSI|nr:AGAP003468-PA-like protein [Anopheles sinensis]
MTKRLGFKFYNVRNKENSRFSCIVYASELQKPTSTNAAVVRFYRYVQAARDGQDQRDCQRLYSQCTINMEKKKKKK